MNLAVKQNLMNIKNKNVLNTSKLKNCLKIFRKLFQTRIKFRAKPLSSQDKAFRFQQN